VYANEKAAAYVNSAPAESQLPASVGASHAHAHDEPQHQRSGDQAQRRERRRVDAGTVQGEPAQQ
jgi:hypothetical protein